MSKLTQYQENLLSEIKKSFESINAQIPRGAGILKLDALIAKADQLNNDIAAAKIYNNTYKNNLRKFMEKYFEKIAKEFQEAQIPISISLFSENSFQIEISDEFRKKHKAWGSGSIQGGVWFKSDSSSSDARIMGHQFYFRISGMDSYRKPYNSLDELFADGKIEDYLFKAITLIRDIQSKSSY